MFVQSFYSYKSGIVGLVYFRRTRELGEVIMMNNRVRKTARMMVSALVAIAIFGVANTAEAASVPAISILTITGTGNPGAGTEQGWQFNTNSTITIDAFGYYDEGSNGLADNHLVSLWDASTENLITSATVLAGTFGTLIDGFRYFSITPVALDPGGAFVISAFNPTSADGNITLSTLSAISEISYDNGRLGFGAGFPDIHFSSPGGRFGPNFSVSVNAVPIPAAIWLFGTALIGLVGFGNRRKVA
jgi:hypothetical protein